MFKQIFVERDYDRVQPLSPPRFIIDGGANVGYSAVYFLTRFPGSKVVAVEADDRNFAMLALNLAFYSSRATAINAAIWSHCGPLGLSRGTFMDGREWATHVVEFSAGDLPAVEGIDIHSLLERSGYDRIDVLKLDVEGAEVPIFQHSDGWIDLVDDMVVELHDAEARATFYGALPAGVFVTVDVGDLTIASRRGYPAPVL